MILSLISREGREGIKPLKRRNFKMEATTTLTKVSNDTQLPTVKSDLRTKFKIYDVNRGFFAFTATGYPRWVKKIEDGKTFNTFSEAVEMVLDGSEKVIRANGDPLVVER
jgi:hypothetical protein